MHTDSKHIRNMRKSYLFGALAVAAVAIVDCTGQAEQKKPQGLVIEKQGVFSSGGRVTEAIPGEYDPTQNWLDQERKGHDDTCGSCQHDVSDSGWWQWHANGIPSWLRTDADRLAIDSRRTRGMERYILEERLFGVPR